MDWKELGVAVAKLGLPLLGAALPLPGGAAIGTALAGAIGAQSDKPEDIFSQLALSPANVQAAKEFQAKHEERMLEITSGHEERSFQQELDDKKSARQREVDMANSSGASMLSKNMTAYMGLLIVVSTFILCAVLAFTADGELKPSQERVFLFILGAVIPLCTMVAQYYFGSSRGDAANSQHNRDVINRNNWH